MNILLIDDNLAVAQEIETWLTEMESRIVQLDRVDRVSKGMDRLRGGGIDLVLLDLSLPDLKDLDSIRGLHECAPHTDIILLSAAGEEPLARAAVRNGALVYLMKEGIDRNRLTQALDFASRLQGTRQELNNSEEQLAATMLENARLQSRVDQASRELTTLLAATRAVTSTLDLEDVLAIIAEQLVNITGVNGCSLSEWDRDADAVITWIEWRSDGHDHADEPGTSYPLSDYPSTRDVLEACQPKLILADDPEADPMEVALMQERGVSGLLMLPLGVGERVIGLVELDDNKGKREFTPQEIRLCQAMADQAAIAIENARLYEEAQREIIERKRAEDQLLHDALHDGLTGLPNRALFMDRLGQACERMKRRKDYRFAVLFLDFDHFKVINDSLGHYFGDLLLVESARRLGLCLRSVDTVARLGGDEFVVLLEEIVDINEAELVAGRLQGELAGTFDLQGHQVHISASIGIVGSTNSHERPEDILRDADIAMYRAKALGRRRYEVFDTKMRERAMERLVLENDLRSALEREDFLLYYQPIISIGSGALTGFEALLRWDHPELGLIPPAEFLPVAEETGLVIPIGEWVLREACRQMQTWQSAHPVDPALTISVNISGKQINQPGFIELIQLVLEESNLNPDCLKLEITENALFEDKEAITLVLLELRRLGVQVQMDDFGTGYSSLSYLHQFPLDTIKIDQSFIARMVGSDNQTGIVKTIVNLAHSLGMVAIAEGVETPEQLETLKVLECEYAQGFHFARPMPPGEVVTFLAGGPRGHPPGLEEK